VLCSNDESCCNASCGTCVPPLGGCVDILCPLDCSALAAAAEGACDVIIGVTWTGTSCTYISGCVCVGEDCANLFSSVEECNTVFSACS